MLGRTFFDGLSGGKVEVGGAIKCAGGMNFLLTTEDTESTEVTFFTLTYCNSL